MSTIGPYSGPESFVHVPYRPWSLHRSVALRDKEVYRLQETCEEQAKEGR
jgi:hypothetical protein